MVLFVRRDVVNQCLEFADDHGTAAGQRTNHMQAGSQSGRQAGRQADRQVGRQTGRSAGRQAGRQTRKLTEPLNMKKKRNGFILRS